jgi:integrase
MYVLKVLRHMLQKGLSRSSIEQAKNVISGVAEFAIDLEELNINPTYGAMKRLSLKRQPSSNSIVIFTKEEITLLLETCKTYRPDFYFLFLTAFRTGLRLGEILALEWENVNWKEGYIVVDSSWRNGHLDSTKTGKTRNVDLSNQLVSELSKLLKKRKEEALKLGTNEIVPIIFHTHQKYTSQNSVRNVWKKVLAKAGLDYRKFHSTRHTFASLLIAGNYPLNYIKEMLGHHSIQMTVDTYGHLIPSESNSAVNSLDDATIRNLSATTKKETLVTNEDHEGIIDMVAMQGNG